MARTLLDLPEFLREARRKENLTQKQVAEQLEVSPQLVSQWEAGERRPSSKRLVQLASVCKFDLNELPVVTGSSAPDDEVGSQAIIRAMRDIAESAGGNHERLVVHSHSTFGFVSSSMSEVGVATCQCADAGVDVAYFCFPSSLDDDKSTSPASINNALCDSLRRTFEDLRRTGGLSDDSPVAEHLWVIRPKNPACKLDPVARLYGNLIRILAAIRVPGKPSHDASAGENEAGASREVSDWNRIIPRTFELHDLLYHIAELRDGNDVQHRWIRATFGREHDSRYFRSVEAIRDSGLYELARLFE